MGRNLIACGVVEFMVKTSKLNSNANSATLIFVVKRADETAGNYISAMMVLVQNQLQ